MDQTNISTPVRTHTPCKFLSPSTHQKPNRHTSRLSFSPNHHATFNANLAPNPHSTFNFAPNPHSTFDADPDADSDADSRANSLGSKAFDPYNMEMSKEKINSI